MCFYINNIFLFPSYIERDIPAEGYLHRYKWWPQRAYTVFYCNVLHFQHPNIPPSPPLFLEHCKLWLTPQRGKHKGKALNELKENILQVPTTAIALLSFWAQAMPYLLWCCGHTCISPTSWPGCRQMCGRSSLLYKAAPGPRAVLCALGLPYLQEPLQHTALPGLPATPRLRVPLASRNWDGGWGCFTAFLAAGKRAALWI